jgi:glycosidase
MFEFHVSRLSRDRYGFEESLFSTSGNVIFADFSAARRFADKMNKVRNAARYPDRAVKASDINAMGLIDEVLHYVIELYRRSINPHAISEAYSHSSARLGDIDTTLEAFVDVFPSVDVYKGLVTTRHYLNTKTLGTANTHISLEEMLLLYIANKNPAFRPYLELFDDKALQDETLYPEIIKCIEEYFASQPRFGPHNQNLLELLMAPAKAAPNSLFDQLEYIRAQWGTLLSDLLLRILGGLDFIKEERKAHFFGPGPALVPRFGPKELEEIERFSPDEDWMPHLVLIAKTVYVWLHQLSKKYGRHISRLDEIPDQEIEMLSRWGFTGLWLIGIWERSPASRRIKQLTGNPEAAASAYSIYDYVIAKDLGGKGAFENLKARAKGYGIRVGTDMVPNHMGIYSKWIIEHPERFIQLDYSPFPSYSFTGENLSWDDRVEIYIEDGYWDRRDAAVVFKRYDRHTGDVRYIYHGNDGTSMPWNDTAQLDFLKPGVREAVIQTTIEIAKDFPIIRFDAAMTLAKRHFQRLWYPLPGYGGDIPSRAGQSVSQDDFDRMFSVEFWRELVDRVASEVPETLLLAEAFWLMEGYFVRSLGMHRVYNSAFMNMLKDEENSKYRDVLKNVLRFNPEILRRFVNFMNNPDEEPAIEQFGKEDKYFGVATMMVTMPGLPMFGHGQIEGFAEKYGMEYTRSYWDESTDDHLVWRHEREIFPLLKKRHLFSGVENFVLYDVVREDGHVNEDIFAYSNMSGDEKALIVYNNRYAEAKGWVRRSVGISKDTGGKRHIIHKNLSESLGFADEDSLYYIFEDFHSGLEYLRQGSSLCSQGLYIHLGAYKLNVLTGFRELRDYDGQCRRLCEMIGGQGVPDVMVALQELYLEKVLNPFKELLSADLLRQEVLQGPAQGHLSRDFEARLSYFLIQAREFSQGSEGVNKTEEAICSLVISLLGIGKLKELVGGKKTPAVKYLFSKKPGKISEDLSWWRIPLIWCIISQLGYLFEEDPAPTRSRALMDEWMLTSATVRFLKTLGIDESSARYETLLIEVLTRYQDWDDYVLKGEMYDLVRKMFSDSDVRAYLGANEYDGKWWFNKESTQELLYWLYVISAVKSFSLNLEEPVILKKKINRNYRAIMDLNERSSGSGYNIERFLALIDDEPLKRRISS